MLFKGLIDFISNVFPITGNEIADNVLFYIIGIASFVVAWFITGMLADICKHDSNNMSDVHWFFRTVVFALLFSIFIGIAHLIKWIRSFKWWVYLIIVLFVILFVLPLFVMTSVLKKYTKRKKENKRPRL